MVHIYSRENKIAKTQPLGSKNVNFKYKGSRDNKKERNSKRFTSSKNGRHLQNKNVLRSGSDSPKIIKQNLVHETKNDEHIHIHKSPVHSTLPQSGRVPVEIPPNVPALSKSNLKKLQKEINQLEVNPDICQHFFCSLDNFESIELSRVCLLFELEMTVNGDINLRNDCYYSKVYYKLDPNWPQSNCLKEKLPSGLVPLPMSQIVLPQPIDFSSYQRKEEKSVSDITVSIQSFIEEDIDTLDAFRSKRKIPANGLFSRDKRDVFDNVKIDVNQIMNDQTSSSIIAPLPNIGPDNSTDYTPRNSNSKMSYFRI